MLGLAQLTLIDTRDVGRLAFRRAGEMCPAYLQSPFGTGATR